MADGLAHQLANLDGGIPSYLLVCRNAHEISFCFYQRGPGPNAAASTLRTPEVCAVVKPFSPASSLRYGRQAQISCESGSLPLNLASNELFYILVAKTKQLPDSHRSNPRFLCGRVILHPVNRNIEP